MKPSNKPPAGEPYVWLTRELLRSDAWRTAGVNTLRFIHFLMIEHMGKGGRENGKLKAPYRQLGLVGIGARRVADAIREAEELGLVDCHRGGMRVATIYGLTWLDAHDCTPATNRWRAFSNPALATFSQPKIRNLHDKGNAALHDKGNADGEICMTKGM